ncbi:hypothetical protein E4U43_006463, partial [Claviceps pusilla]
MDHAGTAMGGSPAPAAKSMGGMGGGSGCKISMLFNLYTIDACFLSSQWRISSHAGFAGSCIGVFLLTLSLEMLRRAIKEYDRYLIRQHRSRHQPACLAAAAAAAAAAQVAGQETPPSPGKRSAEAGVTTTVAGNGAPPFRPSAPQQAVRALLHLLAFFVGYILML